MDDQTGFDPKRRLCADGTCTGIIGPDGRCGECGRLATSNGVVGVADGALSSAGEAPAGLDASVTDELATMDVAPSSDTAGQPGFDPGRRLCADGACVGVIGSSGVCTVCGRAPE